MATLKVESRTLPTYAGDVGGDEIYLGTPTGDGGQLIDVDGDDGDDSQDDLDDSAGPGDSRSVQPTLVVGAHRYAFVMWNVTTVEGTTFDDFVEEGNRFRITKAPPADLVATAWYVEIGPSGDPVIPGPPHVVTLGFDRVANKFFRTPPIESVAPRAAWAGGEDRSVSTAVATVAIDAKDRIEIEHRERVMVRYDRDALFERWRMPGAIIAGDVVTVEKGRSGLAIAIFRQRERIEQVLTIPWWLWKALHGIVDDEVIAHIRPHPIDGPDWGGPLALETMRPTLERAGADSLRAMHDGLTGLAMRARELAAFTATLMKR